MKSCGIGLRAMTPAAKNLLKANWDMVLSKAVEKRLAENLDLHVHFGSLLEPSGSMRNGVK